MSVGFVSTDPLNNLTNLYQRPVVILANRAPTINDVQPVATFWQNGLGGILYQTSGAGIWYQASSSVTSVLGTANQITATPSGQTVTLSIPTTFIAPGSIAATTTLTATLGNITATNGNLSLAHTGNKLLIHATTAASDSIGITAAMTAGSIVVSTTAVTASSIIFLTEVTPGGTQGSLSYGSIVPGVSFTITSSSGLDTSTVAYLIIN